MIVFLVDSANQDEFGARFSAAFPNVRGAFKVVDYPSLATVDSLPKAVYVFLDLWHSSDGRRRLASELGGRLQVAGCPVLGDLGDELTPAEKPVPLTQLPAVLRAEAPDGIAESPLLETEDDLRDTWCDWVLQGTDPSVINVWPSPPKPDSDGLFRRYGFLKIGTEWLPIPTAASRSWPIADSHMTKEKPATIPVAIRQVDDKPALERVEYWLENGHPRLWRRDDSAACLFRRPIDEDAHRLAGEQLRSLADAMDSGTVELEWTPLAPG